MIINVQKMNIATSLLSLLVSFTCSESMSTAKLHVRAPTKNVSVHFSATQAS